MSTKISALTQATNAEMDDASLAYVVTDPSGTPASRKSTLGRIGIAPKKLIETAAQLFGAAPASVASDFTGGTAFMPRRSGQTCTGVRVLHNVASSQTLKLSLYPGAGGAALATVNVSASAAGIYEGTFASPVALSAGTVYIAASWNAAYQPSYYTLTSPIAGSQTILWTIAAGPITFRDFLLVNWAMAVAGDNNPNGFASSPNVYMIEPLISG